MLKEIYKETEDRMKGAIESFEEDLSVIRSGRAHPGLVEKLHVDYYGTPTPLQQLASISIPEPRTILIRPFDTSMLKTIERSILASDLGLTPNNDGKQIRLNLPPLTEERRRDLVKLVHSRAEEARVAIRNIRRDMNKSLRDFEEEKLISEDELKDSEEHIQNMTNEFIEEVNKIGEKKQKEILEV